MRRDTGLMLACVALLAAITIGWGERIGIHNGEGWDGEAYAAWARDLPATMHTGVTEFQSKRVLPSVLVYYGLDAVGAAHDRGNVILAFQLLDALALLVSCLLLTRIAALLEWSRPATWAAFLALFLSFANARAALYYPVETDPLAFVLAMTIAWAYLGRRPIVHGLATLAASFTWPALTAVGLIMLLLPRPRAPLPASAERWRLPAARAIAVAAGALLVLAIEYSLHHPIAPGGWGGAPSFLQYAHRDLEWVTIAYLAILVALAAFFLANQESTWSIRPYLRDIGWRRLAAGLAGAVAILAIGAVWTRQVGTQGIGFTWRDLWNYYAANAVRAPLWNVVHQVVYFGPIILVSIAAWPRIATVVGRWGPAATLVMAMLAISAVNTDARHLLHLMPLAVVATISATAAWWSWPRVVAFGALAAAWSKLWWHIGYTQIHESRSWPDLRWFMHQGPWASDETFLWHLGGMVVTVALLIAAMRLRDPTTST